ncbi:MAG: dihydrofolate reductase [Pararhodobacter sp.]|nr:dihydrofolate reductase [Pararhodobacter sp.]
MRRLVYDVAISIDGFIARADGTVDDFVAEGDHVTDYLQRLTGYDCVIMGRGTYEFGYRYGMQPGDRPYQNMRHVVISRSLQLPHDCGIEIVREDPVSAVRKIKSEDGGTIYLAGGAGVAGLLQEAGLIDRLILKVNPIVLGTGLPLFAGGMPGSLRLVASHLHETGVVLLTYDF